MISQYYAPFSQFIIENIKKWEVGMVYATLHQIIKNPELKGFIFLYCKRGQKAKCQELKRKIEKYILRVTKLTSNQVVVSFGGTRIRDEIETFLIPKDDPPPVASPTLPNDF